MNAMLSSSLCAPIEGLINALLAQDPAALVQLQPYSGKVLHCECTSPVHFECYLLVEDSRIALQSLYEGEPDASLSASASAFAKIAMSSSQTEALFSPDITLMGDTHLIQALHGIIAKLEIDWEAHFSVIVGDVASHQLGQFFSKSQRWAAQTKDAVLEDIEEYLHEESQILPNKVEFAHFATRLDELKLTLDRINARTQRLNKTLDEFSN
ncbi:MAG: ubiquinone biosynthesis accessory factor UbiJ [Gammaproteobacteria bacterium]